MSAFLSGKHLADVVHVLVVVLFRHIAHAGSKTLSHVVVEAGAHAIAHGPVRTSAQGKGLVQKLPGLPCRQRRGKGTKVAGLIASCVTHYLKARIFCLYVQTKERVLLVVAQQDIVVGPVLLDEACLKQEGFLVRGGGQILKTLGMGQHGRGLGRNVAAKIGEHASSQDTCLADIDDVSPLVPVEIDSGRVGDALRIRLFHGFLCGLVSCDAILFEFVLQKTLGDVQ